MSKAKPTLWIVSEVFYPNETSTAYILTEIARALTEKYEVKVICEDESHQGYVADSIMDDITIHRIKSVNLDEKKLFSRALRQLILTLKLFNASATRIKKKDKVLIVTNPAPLILAMSFMKKCKGFDYTILVHDVFPENTIPAKIYDSTENRTYKFLKRKFDSAYSRADKLITLGVDMREVIKRKIGNESKVVIIENWADCDRIKAENRHSDKLTLLYAGNLGRVQGLERLIEVISHVQNPNTKFIFRGKGALRNKIANLIDNNASNTNISLGGSYSRGEENDVLNNCDIAFVSLAPGMYGLGVPSKSYNIMAAGKPILFVGDLESEISLMVHKYNIGWCFASEDSEGLIEFLENLSEDNLAEIREKGARAREIAEKYYSRNIVLNKFKNIV